MRKGDLWHSFPVEKVSILLATNTQHGLNEKDVELLQSRYGLNKIKKDTHFHFMKSIMRQLRSPISIVLILAGVATLFLSEYIDAIVVYSAVLMNVLIGVVQEGKAARIFERLQKYQKSTATVLRSGKYKMILATELVQGDIVSLKGGDAVPADIRLIEVKNMSVNESTLSGEWLPVDKISTTLGRALPISEQKNMAWMGTLVSHGGGTGIVVAIGKQTRFGKLAETIQDTRLAMTPLQHSIRKMAHLLIKIIGGAIIIIIAVGLIRGVPFTEILLLAIAVAVAAIPEGLPAAVTVVLALGMSAILKRGGLVKNLLAAETLGSTTVIITDKTGTLTRGEMIVSGVYSARSIEDGDSSTNTPDNRTVLEMAILVSDAFIEDTTIPGYEERGDNELPIPHRTLLVVHGRPIEKAILEAGLGIGISQDELFTTGHKRLDFVPFEPTRRYALSLNECSNHHTCAYFSGAPEDLLKLSDHYITQGKVKRLDDETRQKFQTVQTKLSSEGFRFIATAYKEVNESTLSHNLTHLSDTSNLIFGGLIAFTDAIRDEVPQAIHEVQQAGARVIMATGDYQETARAIANRVGITSEPNAPVLTGTMIEKMNDGELTKALMTYSIIARVLPEQKLRVAHILKNSGAVVAMTGDGVNDAPALRAADIGIAVGSGTEVAKAAADLVLLDNSFSVITTAIAQGRRITSNIRKIVSYLLSTSFTEIILIGSALVVGTPLPLLPTQILWANIMVEGFMSFPFAFEPEEEGLMKRRPEKRGLQNIITKQIFRLIAVVSAVTGLILFGLYLVLYWGGVPIDQIRTIMFVGQTLASILFVFSFKDLTRPLWRIPLFSNKVLLVALAISIGLLIFALTFAPLQKLLTLTTLSAAEVILLGILGLINLATIEVTKMFLFKKSTKYQ